MMIFETLSTIVATEETAREKLILTIARLKDKEAIDYNQAKTLLETMLSSTSRQYRKLSGILKNIESLEKMK